MFFSEKTIFDFDSIFFHSQMTDFLLPFLSIKSSLTDADMFVYVSFTEFSLAGRGSQEVIW